MTKDAGTDPTVADTAPASTAHAARTSVPGYELGALIGAGGMGEIVLARDQEIGRDVAVKRMRGGSDEQATARFLREARIQARLEHPAIVPVYEIGRDDQGHPYFAMKRLGGTTFAEILRTNASRQKLLRAFLDICRAIAFAHSRGVIHRDLKPANIAAGDHGEIYVLDWGLARILDEDERDVATGSAPALEGVTQADTMLGTPGYMAPEQVRDAHSVGSAADVYALGAILFEILAREPVHPRGMEAIATTTAGVDGSPAKRKPDLDIPPELDAACSAALATDPGARPNAVALADQIERYLDGDRDLERRRQLAAEHVATARSALAADQRADAARAASRALALDPRSADAAAVMNRLLFEPPSELPDDLRAKLAASDSAVQRRQSRVAIASYSTIAGFMIIAGINGVVSWSWWIAIMALTIVHGVVVVAMSRRAPTAREMILFAAGAGLLAAMGSRVFGSMIMIPTVTCIMVVSFTSYPHLLHRVRLVISIFVASWLVPIVLEAAGILPRTWSVSGGAIESTSNMLVLGGTSTTLLLVCLHVSMIVVSGLFSNALAVARAKALRDTEIREWHLRQLMPPD